MGMTITTGLTVRFGEGRHIIFIKNPEGFAIVSITIKVSYPASYAWLYAYVGGVLAYALTAVLIKLSILCLYHRIFPSRTMYILSSCIAGVIILYKVALIVFGFLQCVPLSKLWTGGPGACVPTTPAYVTLAQAIPLL